MFPETGCHQVSSGHTKILHRSYNWLSFLRINKVLLYCIITFNGTDYVRYKRCLLPVNKPAPQEPTDLQNHRASTSEPEHPIPEQWPTSCLQPIGKSLRHRWLCLHLSNLATIHRLYSMTILTVLQLHGGQPNTEARRLASCSLRCFQTASGDTVWVYCQAQCQILWNLMLTTTLTIHVHRIHILPRTTIFFFFKWVSFSCSSHFI